MIAALISPGHADNSITIPLGYGRKKTGPVGEEAGFDGYLLRNSSNPHFITADGKTVEKVEVTKVPGRTRFRSRRITGASKAAASCVRRRSRIIAKTPNS